MVTHHYTLTGIYCKIVLDKHSFTWPITQRTNQTSKSEVFIPSSGSCTRALSL